MRTRPDFIEELAPEVAIKVVEWSSEIRFKGYKFEE